MDNSRIKQTVGTALKIYNLRILPAIKVLKAQPPSRRVSRDVQMHADDVIIASYPKSGNTWTRFLIGNLMFEDEPITFANLESKIPSIYLDEGVLAHAPRPRLLKSHEYFDPRYKKVIYVVRDPRDVVLSYYHFRVKCKAVEEGHGMDEHVSRFLAGTLDSHGSWGENVGSWLGARGQDSNFLLLKYENLLENPARELRRVASFLSIDATNERIERAIKLSSFGQMRRLEQEHDWEAIKNTRKDKAFVRSARSGQWRTGLPETAVADIEQAWGHLMQPLGYDRSYPRTEDNPKPYRPANEQ